MKTPAIVLSIVVLFSHSLAVANTQVTYESMDACLLSLLKTKSDATSIGELKADCEQIMLANNEVRPVASSQPTQGLITQRVKEESFTQFRDYVITPHRMNYMLPAVTTDNINRDAYASLPGYQEELRDLEAKFQLSLKVPLNNRDLLTEGDGLFVAFTMQAWWQVYTEALSRPFRETNYQPEIFYFAPLGDPFLGGESAIMVGLEHQSNGQNQFLSRSWNRVYLNFLYEKQGFALSFRPWYRLPEDEKEFQFDPSGDDNPDIDDFLGHFELGMVYRNNDIEWSFLGRQNFATHKGFAELGVSFPIWGKLRGYSTLNTGYGDSLIDFNHKQTRFGLGLSLNRIL